MERAVQGMGLDGRGRSEEEEERRVEGRESPEEVHPCLEMH